MSLSLFSFKYIFFIFALMKLVLLSFLSNILFLICLNILSFSLNVFASQLNPYVLGHDQILSLINRSSCSGCILAAGGNKSSPLKIPPRNKYINMLTSYNDTQATLRDILYPTVWLSVMGIKIQNLPDTRNLQNTGVFVNVVHGLKQTTWIMWLMANSECGTLGSFTSSCLSNDAELELLPVCVSHLFLVSMWISSGFYGFLP